MTKGPEGSSGPFARPAVRVAHGLEARHRVLMLRMAEIFATNQGEAVRGLTASLVSLDPLLITTQSEPCAALGRGWRTAGGAVSRDRIVPVTSAAGDGGRRSRGATGETDLGACFVPDERCQ